MTQKSRKDAATAPVFAAVGAADLAIEQLKKTLAQVEALADQVRSDLEERVAKANAEAHEAAVRAGKVAQDAPEQVLNQGLTVASLATHAYDEMTRRGQRLVGKGVAGVREDKRVKVATDVAGTTVKAAADTASTVRTLADKARGKKDSAAVTVKGSVVDGESPEATPVKNVRAATDKPATPRKRTPKRATTAEDVAPAEGAPAKKATKRPSRASVTSKAGSMKTATTAADTDVPTPAEVMPATEPAARAPRKRTASSTSSDPVAASSGNQAATDAPPATSGTASAEVEASAEQAATE